MCSWTNSNAFEEKHVGLFCWWKYDCPIGSNSGKPIFIVLDLKCL
jgi:hypothetical protein